MHATRRYTSAFGILTLTFAAGCASVSGDWDGAARIDTIQSYRTFLKAHPTSEYSQKAGDRIEELAFRAALNSQSEGTKAFFLQSYPNSKNASQVSRSLRDLRYKQASDGGSPATMKAFITTYAEGQDSEALRARLPGAERWQKDKKLALILISLAPQSGMDVVNSRPTGKLITFRDKSMDVGLRETRQALEDGANPNGARISGVASGAVRALPGSSYVAVDFGSSGQPVQSDAAGMSLLEYCRTIDAPEVCEVLVKFGGK